MTKKEILFSENEIMEMVDKVSKEINKDYNQDEEIVILSLLRGSFIFCSDLVRRLHSNLVIDFITTSSYHSEKISSGFVEIVTDFRENIKDKNVIIVDDILDSGRTLKRVCEHVRKSNPKTLKTCVLFDKPSRRTEDIEADYVGKVIDDLFIVGYGLNYGDYYRNVPYIFSFVE